MLSPPRPRFELPCSPRVSDTTQSSDQRGRSAMPDACPFWGGVRRPWFLMNLDHSKSRAIGSASPLSWGAVVRIEAEGKGLELPTLRVEPSPSPNKVEPRRERRGMCSQAHDERQLSKTIGCIADAIETSAPRTPTISYAASPAGDLTVSNHRAQSATHFEGRRIA